MGRTWLAVPRDWVASLGDIAKFAARDFYEMNRINHSSAAAGEPSFDGLTI